MLDESRHSAAAVLRKCTITLYSVLSKSYVELTGFLTLNAPELIYATQEIWKYSGITTPGHHFSRGDTSTPNPSTSSSRARLRRYRFSGAMRSSGDKTKWCRIADEERSGISPYPLNVLEINKLRLRVLISSIVNRFHNFCRAVTIANVNGFSIYGTLFKK